MHIGAAILAGRVRTYIMLRSFRDFRSVRGNHLRIDVKHIDRLRIIHHIGIMPACRPHIHFHDRITAGFPDTCVVLRDIDELEMNEAPVHAKRPGSLSAIIPQLCRDFCHREEMDALVILYRINHRRISAHGLEQRITVGVQDRVIGTDITAQEFLHDIKFRRELIVKGPELVFPIDLLRAVCADADVRFDDHRISNLFHESQAGIQVRNNVLTCGRNSGLDKKALHAGLPDHIADPVFSCADSNVEIRTQPCIHRKPVFIQGFQPVDPAVFVNEKSNRAVNLIIILQRVHNIVFCQGILQLVIQCVIRYVSDSEHIYAMFVQAVAELRAGYGVRR